MEEEIETMLVNLTDYGDFNETNYHYERPLHIVIHEICLFIVASVSIIADVAIICMIARNKYMRTKRNLIIMNFAITEAMFYYCIPSFFTRFLELFAIYIPRYFDCLLVSVEFTYLVTTFMLLSTLSLYKILEKIPLVKILASIYAISATIILTEGITCVEGYSKTIVQYAMLAAFVILTATVVIQDGLRYFKSTILQSEILIGYNLARIAAYNWLGCLSTVIITKILLPYYCELIISYVWLSAFSNGMYSLAYLVRNDADYKICFYNLFRKIDRDVSVSFADDFNNPIDNIGKVSINVNK